MTQETGINNLTSQKTESTSRSFGFWSFIGLGLIFFDQLTKYLATYFLDTIFLNDKFAFSLPVPPLIMYILYGAVFVSIIVYVRKRYAIFSNSERFAWTLIFAGGISNIAERLQFGYVRDFIPILNGVFNLADLFIIVGAFFLLFHHRRVPHQKKL